MLHSLFFPCFFCCWHFTLPLITYIFCRISIESLPEGSVEQNHNQTLRKRPASVFLSGWTHWWPSILYFCMNDPLLTGIFPSVFRSVAGKKSLDTKSLKNYRPVTSLPFLSKITKEKKKGLLSFNFPSIFKATTCLSLRSQHWNGPHENCKWPS